MTTHQPAATADALVKKDPADAGGQAFEVELHLKEGYEFSADFHEEGVAALVMDEPAPLGSGRGPNAARVLAAAVGNCLSASALYCLRKARIDVRTLRTVVRVSLGRNLQGRQRITGLAVAIHPEVAAEDRQRMGRCLELFEDFCVVTQSVRRGIAVDVQVET